MKLQIEQSMEMFMYQTPLQNTQINQSDMAE